MDFFSALKISASGLSVQRTRVDLATSNLANAESTRGPDGTPYRRMDPVLEAVPFAVGLDAELDAPMGVRVAEVVRDEGPGRRVYNPSHPDADPQGYVTLPDVDPLHEVINLMTASRSYDANATAVETLKTMAQRAMEIGR